MNDKFNQESSHQKLVFVSDCVNTLYSPMENNEALIDFLIRAKKEGNEVFIASTQPASSAKMISMILECAGETEDALACDGILVFHKSEIDELLSGRGITIADYVFDDEKPNYFSKVQIGQHIDPEEFKNPASLVVKALPGNAPQP